MRTAAMDFRAAYDHMPCAVIIRGLDDGVIHYANPGYQRHLPADVSELIGESIFALKPEHADAWHATGLLAARAPDRRHSDLTTVDGIWYERRIEARPDGLLVVALRDVTAEVAAVHALRVLTGGPLTAVEYRVSGLIQRPPDPVR